MAENTLDQGWPAAQPAAQHTRDEECTVDPATGCCTACGVYHGDPCPACGGAGFHRDGCPENDVEWEPDRSYQAGAAYASGYYD